MISVDLKNLSFAFRRPQNVLQNLSLRIEPGDFVSLLGPSGCGKSTLLRLVAGLLSPTEGSVIRAPGPWSFAFQDARLLPWRTVTENVLLPFEVSRQSPPNLEDLLRRVGLWEARHRFPHELSGGMRQRAALARALVTRPQLLLMDEPFSALDEGTREDLENLLRELWESQRCTCIFVTHSLTEAVFLSERVIVMGGRGRLLADRKISLSSRGPGLRLDHDFLNYVRLFSDDVRESRRDFL